MSKYLRNNIGFRRSSAAQYAGFYSAKSYMLGEILDGPKSNIFSPTAREILLQYFSAMELLLRDIEVAFIACSDGVVSDVAVSKCKVSAREFSSSLHQIIKDNPQDFDPVFAEPWAAVVAESATPLLDAARDLLEGDIESAFCMAVSFCTSYLNHIMFILHELVCLLNGAAPILYLSDIDIRIQARKSYSLSRARLNVYRTFNLLKDDAEIKVLCEFDDAKVRDDERSLVAYRALLDSVSTYSLKLS